MPYKDPVINKIKSVERSKRWAIKNPQKVKEKQKRYRQRHKEKIREAYRIWRTENKEKAAEATRNWKKKNRERVLSNKRIRNKTCYLLNPNHKLRVLLRSRLRLAIKKKQKKGSAVKMLQCTIEELKLHLESKFQTGMNWNNWSRKGWHIDHIKPLSSFNLEDEKELAEACHYTNLQPLWAIDNLKKTNKVTL